MKLEELYPNFAEMTDKEQLAFIRNYRNKRFMELQTYNVDAPKKKTTKAVKRKIVKKKALPPMQQSELDILKKLGITSGQISKVRK